MCSMDRREREHRRQFNSLNELKKSLNHFPYPACIRNFSGYFESCNSFFHEVFLCDKQSPEEWFMLQSVDLIEMLSKTEIDVFLQKKSQFIIDGVFINNEFWTISIHLFSNEDENYAIWTFFKSVNIRYIADIRDVHFGELNSLLNKLESKCRPEKWNAFNLYASGLSHTSISRMLKIPLGSSKNYASQICNFLESDDRDKLIISLYHSGLYYKIYNNVKQIIKKLS